MYQAELRGKLSSRIERMEDILTSNVFSFFKYATREIFLKGYLGELGFDVSDKEAKEAEFIFWPHFEEKENRRVKPTHFTKVNSRGHPLNSNLLLTHVNSVSVPGNTTK